MDNTILNVAPPTLVRDLDATASQLQWIVDSYDVLAVQRNPPVCESVWRQASVSLSSPMSVCPSLHTTSMLGSFCRWKVGAGSRRATVGEPAGDRLSQFE